jgi:hypothetical protein
MKTYSIVGTSAERARHRTMAREACRLDSSLHERQGAGPHTVALLNIVPHGTVIFGGNTQDHFVISR